MGVMSLREPEIRWLEGYSPHKPPFGVRSCEVATIHPGDFALEGRQQPLSN